jgi:hypothetical protein
MLNPLKPLIFLKKRHLTIEILLFQIVIVSDYKIVFPFIFEYKLML